MSLNPFYGTRGYGRGRYGNEPIENLPIGYYLNLITSQYRRSPKLNALLYLLLKKFDDVSQCLVEMDAALDLDNAVGAQLDLIGDIVGAERLLPFQPSGGVSPVLDDQSYRIFINARIAWNQWDGTIDTLNSTWERIFPGGQIIIGDQQNMTAEVYLSGDFTSVLKDMITHGLIVPRPEGVLYGYLFPQTPILGFDRNDSFMAGFDIAYFT